MPIQDKLQRPMATRIVDVQPDDDAQPCLRRRGFLRIAALAVGSLAALPVLAKTAIAAKSGKPVKSTAKSVTKPATTKPTKATATKASSSKPTPSKRTVTASAGNSRAAAGKSRSSAKVASASRDVRDLRGGRGSLSNRRDRFLKNGRFTTGADYKARLRGGKPAVAHVTIRERDSDRDTRSLSAPAVITDSRTLSPDEIFRNGDRQLSFYAPNTGESIREVFWTPNTGYLNQSIKELSWTLRDHHNDEFKLFDPRVFDILYAVQLMMGRRETHIISGYRSRETNNLLREESRGVAKNSYHIQAKALDVRMPGASLAQMRRAALSLRAGGVGYYPRSNFVHMDSGPVRSWG